MKKLLTLLPASLLIAQAFFLIAPSSTFADFGAPSTCNGGPGLDIQDFGCISTKPGDIINWVLKFILGFVGGLAILLIILGGFKIASAQGDPSALEDGRSMITAAIVGLVVVLLATTILGILGINILGLPNFKWSGNGIVISK
jgi:hypothetical protein